LTDISPIKIASAEKFQTSQWGTLAAYLHRVFLLKFSLSPEVCEKFTTRNVLH